MKLKSFNFFTGLLIILFFPHLGAEEKIDIWKNKNNTTVQTPDDKKKK